MGWTRALSGWWSVWSETFTGHPDRRTSRKKLLAPLIHLLDNKFLLEDIPCKPGADNSPLTLCLLWLWTVWISAFRSSLPTKWLFLSPGIIWDVLWMDICLFHFFKTSPASLSAAAPVTWAIWGCWDRNISLTHHMKYCNMGFLFSVSD